MWVGVCVWWKMRLHIQGQGGAEVGVAAERCWMFGVVGQLIHLGVAGCHFICRVTEYLIPIV